jgi:hypothetical protein
MLLIYTDKLHSTPQWLVGSREEILLFVEEALLTSFFAFDHDECFLDCNNISNRYIPEHYRERSAHDFDTRLLREENTYDNPPDKIERIFWG